MRSPQSAHATTLMIALVALVAALAPPSAAASTEEQRARWVQKKPRLFSHGQEARPVGVCFVAGTYRADGGGDIAIDGPICPAVRAPLPVHPGARVVVRTPPQAGALLVSPERAPLRRPCREFSPGRWECRMPDPGRDSYAFLEIDYPGAEALWSFQVQRHSPDRH